MLLQDKIAVIYGAGGSLGGAISKALAAAGARVFLTGWKRESVQKIADEILAEGGKAEVAVVDARDEQAIGNHLRHTMEKAGHIDISFNAVGIDVIQNILFVEMKASDFVQPITEMMHTRFLTAVAAGKVMMKQGSGIILSLTATPAGIGYPYTGGFGPACSAIECFSRNLASELGIYGVRVVNIRSGGSPDSAVFNEAIRREPEIMKNLLGKMEADTMLKRLPLMADIANTAVFLCSDLARNITGSTIDLTCGTTEALNYRVIREDQNQS